MRTATANDLDDRRSAAADAKAALLSAYRARMDAAEPTRLARQKERVAVAAAREKRREERDQIRAEARERQQAEERVHAEAAAHQDAANVAARAEVEARERADSMITRVIVDEAARKAARDRRYASRKARQR